MAERGLSIPVNSEISSFEDFSGFNSNRSMIDNSLLSMLIAVFSFWFGRDSSWGGGAVVFSLACFCGIDFISTPFVAGRSFCYWIGHICLLVGLTEGGTQSIFGFSIYSQRSIKSVSWWLCLVKLRAGQMLGCRENVATHPLKHNKASSFWWSKVWWIKLASDYQVNILKFLEAGDCAIFV